MALSVSGFPEPSRHAGPASSVEVVSTADDGQEGSGRSIVMNSPRLRGLFGGGGNGVSSVRKAASPGEGKPTTTSSTSSKADENDGSSQLASSSSPSSSALTFAPSFEPISQQKYDFDSPQSMFDSATPKEHATSKRIQPLPPLPRKAKASPVRLGPSLTRLDIGAVGWSRLPMAAHVPSKPPPSVVIEEWPQKDAALSPAPLTSPARPLPTLPPFKTEPSNSSTHSSVAGSSRRVNVEQANAVAGPSMYPGALVNFPTTTTSLSAPASPAATPPSKVLIAQPMPQRTTKHSLTMRYQPLVATPSSTPTSSSADSAPSSVPSASPIRPLPRIPPITTSLLANSTSGLPALPPLSTEPLEDKIKRPKTSPGIITGFAMGPRGPVSANTPSLSRSPFTTITTTWPSRNSELANSPLPIGSPLKASRARSHSRLSRRDRSFDSSYYSTFSTPRTSPANSRVPSPIGGRPALPRPRSRSVRHAATIDQFPRNQGSPTIPTAPFSGTMALQMHVADAVTVGKRPQPPSPPTGPVKARPKPRASGSPPIARILTTQALSQPQPSVKTTLTTPTPITAATATTIYSLSTTPPTTAPCAEDADDMYSIDAPLHSHPQIDAFTDTDSMANPPLTPISVVEVYVDDQDYSTMSRSPSPIRYARPDSRGHLSSTDDDDDGPSSSSSSDSDDNASFGQMRRRTQLRSYRNSYRPRAGASPPHIPYRRSPSPISEQQQQQQPAAWLSPPEQKEKEKAKKKATRSYFAEYMTTSAPATRTPSPERKSRSRQPRRLANAVSLALRNASPSPRRTNSIIKPKAQMLVDDGEVLDIGPMPPESTDTASSISETPHGRSAAKVGWVKTMARKRSEVLLAAAAALGPNSVSHLSNAGTAPVEMDGAETPYMWISTSRPPVAPASFIPTPPVARHRRIDSAEHLLPNSSKRERERDSEKEIERYNLACGLPLPTGNSSKPRLSDPSSSNAQTHTATSSISIPSTPFSGFGIGSRTRKISKHVSSPSVPPPLHYGQPTTQVFEETLDITRQNIHDPPDDHA